MRTAPTTTITVDVVPSMVVETAVSALPPPRTGTEAVIAFWDSVCSALSATPVRLGGCPFGDPVGQGVGDEVSSPLGLQEIVIASDCNPGLVGGGDCVEDGVAV